MQESHFKGTWLRDVILGGQDGLVNVLGVVLGVAAAGGDNRVLVAASLAAAFAEAVSMGAVAYTSALAQRDYYQKELQREKKEIEEQPETERQEIRKIYEEKGFKGKDLDQVVTIVTANKDVWLKTMMREELDLVDVGIQSILRSSAIVGITALVGAFIPVFPFLINFHQYSIPISLAISGLVLFSVGVYQAKTYVGSWWRSGLQMLVIGLGAATAGFVIGKIFEVK